MKSFLVKVNYHAKIARSAARRRALHAGACLNFVFSSSLGRRYSATEQESPEKEFEVL